MSNRLNTIVSEATQEFRTQILTQVNAGTRQIKVPGGFKDVNIPSQKNLLSSLNSVCPSNKPSETKDLLVSHYNELKSYISITSSPQAFKTAWDLKSSKINSLDLESITSLGGQIIPMNENSRVLRYEQQGALFGQQKRFILGVRHSEGNYDDELDDLGRFSYQPPNNVSGMMRYRFLQFLSNQLNIDLILLVIMWFKYDIGDHINHIFLLAPAKVIDYKKDIKDFNKSLHHPINLQLIQRTEAFSKVGLLNALNLDNSELESRSELNLQLAREFSYDKLPSPKKGGLIKKWAQQTNKKCPGSICGEIAFSELALNQIAFGHIISQKWSLAFPHLQNKKDHPDNLYLTCNRCNSQLLDYFPDNQLRNRILKRGTIGDWLRSNEKNIRALSN